MKPQGGEDGFPEADPRAKLSIRLNSLQHGRSRGVNRQERCFSAAGEWFLSKDSSTVTALERWSTIGQEWRSKFGSEARVTWWRGLSQKVRLGLDAFRGRRRGDSEDPIAHFLEAAREAERERNPDKMRRCSYKLIRYEQYERAWELRTRAAAIDKLSPLPDWAGDDLAGRTILVRGCMPKHRIGEELRLSRFIADVANRARRCIVLTEKRLVPLLHRSFPRTDVRPKGSDDAAAMSEADINAYFETIALHCAKNAEEMRRSFVPLHADPSRVGAIRQRYKRNAAGPLIGISWTSRNEGKVLPDLPSWAPLLTWPAATFVSLQYGDIAQDLALLREFAPGRTIHDPEIDQLADLDGFAAQIASLDAAVSVSNTTIDMAGMLGTPTLHIRNDKASEIWPPSGPSPWYPDMIFLYRQHRPWPEVFARARQRLEQMLSTNGQA